MAKQPRVLLNLFGGTGPTDDFEKFGSQTAGGSVKTKNVADIQTLSAWNNGWKDAINDANKAPFLEDMNAVMFVHSYMATYLFQEGIPEYDSNTTYFIGSIVKKSGTSELYASLTDNNISNPLPAQTDNTNWHFLSTAALSAGNTASRPATPVTGFVYLNTEVNAIQRYNGATYDTILVVPAATVTEVELAASVAGNGLSGGAGSPLAVNVDNSTIELNSDALRVKDLGITTAKLAASSVTDAKIVTMSSSKLTGALPAIDGSALTGVVASSLASGAALFMEFGMDQGSPSGLPTPLHLIRSAGINVVAGDVVEIHAHACISFTSIGAGGHIYLFLRRDGTVIQIVPMSVSSSSAALQHVNIYLNWIDRTTGGSPYLVAPGVHTYDIYWNTQLTSGEALFSSGLIVKQNKMATSTAV